MLAVAAPAADLLAAARRALARWGLDAELIVGAALKTALILALAFAARRLLGRLARRIVARADDGDPHSLSAREQRAHTVAQIITQAGTIVIVVAALLAILSIFFDIRPLLAGAGLVGLAVTIGGQTIVRDFITGFFLLTEQQFAVGDRVRIGGVEGVVHRITLRMVVLRGGDGALHYVANGSISAVSNLSHARNGAAGALSPQPSPPPRPS